MITGASSGLGEQLAIQLSRLGVKKLIFASRNIKEMQRVKDLCENGVEVQICQIDLSKPEECMDVIKREVSSQKVDILINNGGISMRE